MRGITREKKAGHTGTLDPMATGVLPIMLGGATRFLNFIPDSDKRYRAKFLLGKRTDTLDITGSVIEEKEVLSTKEDVLAILDGFRGEIEQVPPMYSAVSVGGQRLYDLARKGIEVERQSRKVEIKSLELVSSNGNEYEIDVACSKGTYIRTLIDDIGAKLGCGAVMTELQRTEAMGFSIENSVTLEEMQRRKDENIGFDDIIIDVEKILESYSKVVVSDAQAKRFSNGGALDLNRIKTPINETINRVYAESGMFLGLGEKAEGELKVLRLLTRRD